MMLEVKNGRLERDGMMLFSNLSFIAREGETICVSGPADSGKTLLLRSFLGFHPLDDGYLSVDGELVHVASAPFFRKQMSYLPQDVDMPYQKVSDMMEQLLSLKRDVTVEESKTSLMALWKELGIDEDVYAMEMAEISVHQRRLLMLTGICVLHRPIVLLDEPTTGMVSNELDNVGHCLRYMAREGACIVVTCREHDAVIRYCDKLLELNTHLYS